MLTAATGADRTTDDVEAHVLTGDGRQVSDTENLWFAHLTGDLYQPLHVGDNGDRGGNQVEVEFRDRSSRYAQNLHGIWDRDLAETAIDLMRVTSSAESQAIGAASARGSVNDWTWAMARTSAYGSLLGNRCTLQAMPIAITGDYARHLVPAIQLQIRRAGVRLAMLLNRVLS